LNNAGVSASPSALRRQAQKASSPRRFARSCDLSTRDQAGQRALNSGFVKQIKELLHAIF